MATFFETITAAINDVAEYGFESQARIDYWVEAISEAAAQDFISEEDLAAQLQRLLGNAYQRLVDRGGLLPLHPDVERFTIERLRPELHAEVERRKQAAISLIKLNRQQMMAEMERRFVGWGTSVPAGGSDDVDRRKVKGNIRKSLASAPFEERRVLIDQAHKLNAALSDIIAMDQDAIAAKWHSRWREAGYNYRKDHRERDKVVYAVKGCWAIERGFMKAGPQGYYEDHERPGELVFCRCTVSWIYNLRDLPKDMLTQKGKDALQEAREKAMAL